MLSKNKVAKAIAEMKQPPSLGKLILTVGALSILGIAWKVPQWQVAAIPDVEKRIAAENAARTVLIQGFGGLFFIVTAYISLENLKATQKNVEATQRNVKATEEKQVAERFSTAIGLLAHESIHVRLGGIYALEKIAAAEDDYYWQVMETLTAYVRERSPRKIEQENQKQIPLLPSDIQAVMTVLSRRKYRYQNGEEHRLDLNQTNLCRLHLPPNANLAGIDLTGANLQGVSFWEVSLQQSQLSEANLNGALLGKANLQGASLADAKAQGAHFSKANLQEARLVGTNLQGTNLGGVNLQRADLFEATLQGANLYKANLQEAELWGANLQKAQLAKTKLQKAKLRKDKTVDFLNDVVGLTWEQLKESEYIREELPDYLLQNPPTASTIEPPESTASSEMLAGETEPPQS